MFFRIFFIGLLTLTALEAKLTPPIEFEGRQILVVDNDTDTILFDQAADTRMSPSSMTKVLTAYIILEEIKSGRISLDTEFKISRKASKAEGTRMYLPEGKTVRVEDVLQGIFVASGNDACICAAENISGSETAFVERMNQKLNELGCNDSHFMNSSGLPHENHYSTCKDLWRISRRLYADFSEYKHFFAQQVFTFGKGTHKSLITQFLRDFAGADGLKTGHTKVGGYGVITSAIVNQQRIFVIINGCKTMVERNRFIDALMNWAYSNFHQVRLFQKDQLIANIDTWMANKPQIPAGLKEDIFITLPKGANHIPAATFVFTGPIDPPLAQGDKVGEIVLTWPGQETQLRYPVFAQASLEKAGYLRRIPLILNYLLFGKNAQ